MIVISCDFYCCFWSTIKIRYIFISSVETTFIYCKNVHWPECESTDELAKGEWKRFFQWFNSLFNLFCICGPDIENWVQYIFIKKIRELLSDFGALLACRKCCELLKLIVRVCIFVCVCVFVFVDSVEGE